MRTRWSEVRDPRCEAVRGGFRAQHGAHHEEDTAAPHTVRKSGMSKTPLSIKTAEGGARKNNTARYEHDLIRKSLRGCLCAECHMALKVLASV